MNTIAVASLVFVCCFGAALAGLYLRLPNDHLDGDFKDTVRLVMGLIATMSALVLSLLISSANSTYDAQAAGLQQMSADIAQLDRMLLLYGPETQEIRTMLRQAVIAADQRIWPADGKQPANLDPAVGRAQTDALYAKLQNLTPKTAAQTRAQDAAWQLAAGVVRIRLLLYEELNGSVTWPLITVLIFWVSVLFLGFGLFARPNVTVLVTIIVGAISVAGAICLILELSHPYTGFIKLSDAPLRAALNNMDR